MKKLKLLFVALALLGGVNLAYAQTDVTSTYITNPGFEGTYTSAYTINTNRYIYKPEGWSVDYKNVSTWNMTAISSSDAMMTTSNFPSPYTVSAGNNKYMVRLRDNQTSEYIDLSQTITITETGWYTLSADLICEDASKVTVKLYAGNQEVTNTKNGVWETRTLLLNIAENQEVKIGIRFENKGAGGHKAGADNVVLTKLAAAPTDVTAFVTNPNFDDGITGWTSKLNAYSNTVKESDDSKPGTTKFWENWDGSAKTGRMFQTITSLPAGTYKLKIMAFADQLGTMTPLSTNVAVYAQGQEVGTTDSEKIRRNYINSTDFTYYQTYAYVDENCKLEIGMRQDVAAFRWLGMDNVTLEYVSSDNQEEAKMLALYQEKWDNVKNTFSGDLTNTDYTCVTGAERTTLAEAPNATVSEIADYKTNADALLAAHNSFINAKAIYDKFDAEKASAIAMGVTENNANAATRPASASASDLQTALQGLYVLEDQAATAIYTVDATDIFGSWTTQNMDTKNNEHWSGNTATYFDRWQTSGYTSSITNTTTLPAGKYVFKVAARAQEGGINYAFNMSVKVGDNDAVYKDFVAKGNTGKGIETSGAANYEEGTFANNGNGYGWEWRFIGFELDEETSVEMKALAQVYANNWVGFSDATLLTSSDNIGICEMMWTNAKTAAEAANNNNDYAIVTGKERSDLEAAITTATENEPTNVEGYQSQTTALKEATEALIAAKETYEEYAQESDIATALGVDVPAIDPASTTAATLVSYMQTMNVADYAATTSYTYDATALLGAWTNAPGTNKGQSWDGSDDDTYYDEYNASARAMTQTVTLPKAQYVLIAKGRASTNGRLTLSDGTNTITFPHKGDDGKGITTAGVANFGDGTYAKENNGRGWEYRFLTFESDGTTATTLTFNWKTANNNWCGLDDITLLAIPETVTVSEDATSAPDYAIANVTLTRTLSASYWNTFSVPFNMAIPEDWEVKEFVSVDGNVMNFKTATTIEAGKPYLVKPESDVENPTYNGVIAENTEGLTMGETGGYQFAAQIYNKDLATDGTVAYLATDGKIKKLTSGSIKGLRAYFIIPAGSDPNNTRISFTDGSQTGIEDSFVETENDNRVYDLQGRQVKAVKKGIYVVNGKKVIK